MEVDSKLALSCEQFQNKLLSSSEFDPDDGILNNENMSAPHPSLTVLALFAKHVYNDTGGDVRDGWELLTTAGNDDLNNGYFGAAHFNSSLQQVVLAHRGTVLGNPGAMWTNLTGVVFKNYSARASSAATFADKVKCAVLEANKQPGKRFQLSITGHSLGGWLAQVSGFAVKYLKNKDGKFSKIRDRSNSFHAHIVAFDSPGCECSLEEMVDTYDSRYRRTVPLEALDVSNYLSAPNRINTFGKHVGSIYRVMIDMSAFTMSDKHTPKYDLTTHNIDNFIKPLEDRNKIHKMKDWPISKLRHFLYDALFKTEYKKFHQKVCHADEYHLESDECEESSMKIHYKTEASVNSGSLRMFSDDELKLLNFWIIFKRETVKINKIQSFLTEHNLGKYKDLFVHFSIDINSRIVTCGSEEDLDQVVGRTKLLVRWFDTELMAAVDRQSREIPKIIYSIANQNYLDSLPECLLDFRIDSIGLREFLQSDHRILQMKSEDCDLEMLRLYSVVRQLREPSSGLDDYVKAGCQTFLRWTDMMNLEDAVDIENLPENDFTDDNLLVINCASTDIHRDLGREQMFQHFLNDNKKKLVLVSDYRQFDFHRFMGIPVSVGPFRAFESNQLTENSQKKLFAINMLDIGDEILSIADFVGEINFNDFSLNINDLIDAITLKNILRTNNLVVKIENSCPNLLDSGVNFSPVDKVVSAETLVKMASSGDLLVISGDRQEEVKQKLTEANSGVEYRVIWVSEKGLAGERKFKQTVLKKPNEKVYWLRADVSSTKVKQIYQKSFYMRRGLYDRQVFNLEKFAAQSDIKDIFIFHGVTSKEDMVISLQLRETEREIFIKNKNIIIAASDEEVNDIMQKNYKKSVHLLKLDNRNQFLWQRSLGPLDSLRSYIHGDTDHPIDEGDLHELKQKVVIIADEPGMGKSTSLASMSRLLRSDPANWVIWIELKHFKIPFDRLPAEPKMRCEFLLKENISQGNLSHGLLRFCLHHKHSIQVYLIFDGFDEINNNYSSKNDIKNEVLRLLQYLGNETTARVWVTTRLNERKLLENALSMFAMIFKKIDEPQQRKYLLNFWCSHLLLEPEECRDMMRSKLEECAKVLYTKAKRHLGEGIQRFMGVPLQMRMLAEVFLQQVEDYLKSKTSIGNAFEVSSVFSLYEKFINVKYNIYFAAKTRLIARMSRELYDMNVQNINETHRMLGLRTLFPRLAEKYYEDFENKLGGAELSKIGLVQSGGGGSENIEFVHRTLDEYFCADQTVHWLCKKGPCHGWAVELLLTNILLRDSNKIVRMFVNNFLLLHPISDTALEYSALKICQLWVQNRNLLFNVDHQTALHVAVEENNEGILDFLIGGLKSGSAQKGLIGFVAALDQCGATALGLAGWASLSHNYIKIIEKLVQSLEPCPYEIKLELLLATSIPQDPSKLLDEYLKGDFVCLETRTAFTRTLTIKAEVVPPFLAAVEESRVRDVEMLYGKMENDVERYYILFALNCDGDTALHIAALHTDNQIDIFKILCNRNIPGIERSYNEQGDTPLHCAARAGHLDIVQHLIDHGSRVNCRSLTDRTGAGSLTALHNAAENGHLPMVKFLVEKGADINSIDVTEKRPLQVAAEMGHLPVVEFLVEMGTDINSADRFGKTAVFVAAERGHLPMVKFLIEKGADLNTTDEDDQTALSVAVEKEYLQMMKFLVKKGAVVDSANYFSSTPLLIAAKNGNLPMMTVLVEKGANVNSTDKYGHTALMIVAGQGHLSMVMFLMEEGADIKSAVFSDRTVLHVAAVERHLLVLEFLINKGADVNFSNKDGLTALFVAVKKGNLPVVEFLVKAERMSTLQIKMAVLH